MAHITLKQLQQTLDRERAFYGIKSTQYMRPKVYGELEILTVTFTEPSLLNMYFLGTHLAVNEIDMKTNFFLNEGSLCVNIVLSD